MHIEEYENYENLVICRAYPLDAYPVKCKQAAAIMLMIMNNLDHRVAQFPHELVTYGGNGQVFSNWAQVHLVYVQFRLDIKLAYVHMYFCMVSVHTTYGLFW